MLRVIGKEKTCGLYKESELGGFFKIILDGGKEAGDILLSQEKKILP